MSMDWWIILLTIVFIVFILLASGQWIAFALGTAGIIGLYLYGFGGSLDSLGSIAFNSINSFTLTAVPLFIFLGNVVLTCGISERFYKGISLFVGKLMGGLLHTNILASTIFAAMSGSSVATVASIGSVAYPEQIKYGYDKKMILGSLGGGGTLGLIIPPSIPMIVYGVLAKESVPKLFMAGVIPGLILSGLFMIYILVRTSLNKNLYPKHEIKVTLPAITKSIFDMLPIFILIVLIIGGIYSGFMTPTEAAAVGSVIALVIAYLYRKLNFKFLVKALTDSIKTTCMVLYIVIGAQILSFFFVRSGLNRMLTEWVAENNFSPVIFLLVMTLIYLVLGALMDGISMIYLTLPILLPIILELGIDPIWFGVYLILLIEIAQITPPVGLNIFVLQGISNENSITEIIQGVLPYFFIMLFSIILFYILPDLVLWLPSTMTT